MSARTLVFSLAAFAGAASIAAAAGRTSDRISAALTLQPGDQAFLAASENAPIAYPHEPGIRELQGKMIVRPITRDDWLAQGLTQAQAADRIAQARARLAPVQWQFVEIHNHVLITLPANVSENQMSAFLMATGDYQYAEPDYIVYPCAVPNDSQYGNAGMYAHRVCRSEPAWNLTTGSTSIIVGVTDTGVRITHEDLASNMVPGANSATGTAIAQSAGGQVNDLNGHGTHVSGTVGARGNNSLGVVGMTWVGKIMPIRVSDSAGGGSSFSALQAGATYAAANGCRVVSTSYSGVNQASNQTVGQTLRVSFNALWFWAAGNANSNLGADTYPDLQIVGGTNNVDARYGSSNFGTPLDICAPGVDIYSSFNPSNTSYTTLTGTSMACPAVAGAAALVLSVNPSLTAIQLRDVLYRNVDDLGTPGEDQNFGPGRLNVGRAAADAYRMAFPATLPFADDFESDFANARWVYRETSTTINSNAFGEPSGVNAVDITSASRLESNAINLTGNADDLTLTFATEARGVEAGETLIVEYLNSADTWVNLATYTGTSEGVFTPRSVVIPTGPAARHAKFAFRFRASAAADTSDHWFVDDVSLGSPTCAADFNGDGVLDFFDYLDFVDAFSAASPSADFNQDSLIDFFDYLDFVDAFATGC